MSSTADLLETLRVYRTNGVRQAEDVVKVGETLMQRGWLKTRSDDVWVAVEQIAVAAIESGRFDLAEACTTRLGTRFPDSPRVDVLRGQVMEGRGLYGIAKEFYEGILAQDEGNVAIRKRLISLHLNCAPITSTASSKSKAVSTVEDIGATKELSRDKGLLMLVQYLDTYYNDLQGWAEAASVYASMRLYAQSLSALSHLILLAPHNPYYLLRHAETAYTMGDFSLAYKEFLRVIELSDGVTSTGGVGRRAAMGAKLCITRLEARGTADVVDPMLVPKKVQEIDLLVTKLVLDSYNVQGAVGAAIARKWVGGGDA